MWHCSFVLLLISCRIYCKQKQSKKQKQKAAKESKEQPQAKNAKNIAEKNVVSVQIKTKLFGIYFSLNYSFNNWFIIIICFFLNA